MSSPARVWSEVLLVPSAWKDLPSQKSAEPGNASYYYSIPRLKTIGEIRVDGERHRIEGLS